MSTGGAEKTIDPARVYFVGAGPGDPELLTVKGARLLAGASLVVYAGSLVRESVIEEYCPPGVEAHDSSGMTLDEMIPLMAGAVREGRVVVRLHTGDPSLYGAIGEQIEALAEEGITSVIVPGVTSASASAASLGAELTVPGSTQTVIYTRLAGRTPVPPSESLRSLASHGSTLCIYLSVGMMDRVAEELIAGGLAGDTPVAVVYRVSWPEERAVTGTLSDIAGKVAAAGITRQAMIIVGTALSGYEGRKSKLYAPGFRHGYREG